MDEYTPRGKPSFPLTLDRQRAASTLSASCRSNELQRAVDVLTEQSEVYLVGGVVRDALLGKESHDIDLAVGLMPDEVETILNTHKFRVIDTGKEHGTLTFLIDEQEGVEITTFRKPSAREETAFGESIEEDLSGRDFTINAVAYQIRSGEFIDPFEGISDLERGICRAVGNPEERFTEDPLRILRMLRFGAAEGRETERETLLAARTTIEMLKRVSVERIRNELIEVLTRDFPEDALKLMYEVGVLEQIVPELLPAVGCEQNEFHIHDVFDHTGWVLQRSESDPILRVASLLHDIGKPATVSEDEDGRRHFYKHEHVGAEISKEVLERLKFSKSDTKRVVRLVKEHMRPLECGPAGVRRIMRDMEEDFDLWLAMKRADAPPIMTKEEFQPIYDQFIEMVEVERERAKGPAYGKLAVNGDDLIALGASPGPRLGQVLKVLEEIVIEDPDRNTREELLPIAKEHLEGAAP